jgi:restriction endonuclease S subunit
MHKPDYARWPKRKLGSLFRIETKRCAPANAPRDWFRHYSIPAFDKTGGPAIEAGEAIMSNKLWLTEPCVLVSKLNPRTPRVAIYRPVGDGLPVCASREFIPYIATSPDVVLDFYSRYFASECFRQQLERIAAGATNSHVRLRPHETLKWKVHFPPPQEQRFIADILNAVDAAIGRTRTALEKAQRLRRGLMQRLFSSGTHRAAARATELGHIPVAWDVINGKEAFNILGVATAAHICFARKGQEPDAWFMHVDDFNDPANHRHIVRTERGFNTADNPKIDTVPLGTIVIAKRGAAIKENRARMTVVPVTLDTNLMGLQLADGINPEFFRYQLEWRQLSRFCENSGVPQLNKKDLYPRPFLRPPFAEQEEIAGVLRAAEEQEDRINDELLKLESLRCGLMQDLLTASARKYGP